MVRFTSAIAAAVLIWSSAAGARQPVRHGSARPVRAVQLISMLSGGGPSSVDPMEGSVEAAEPASGPPTTAEAFAVHDLARRWVAWQMQASLATPGAYEGPEPIRHDDPFAPQARATAPALPDVATPPAAAAIGVPAWMLGGSVSSGSTARFAPGCSSAPYRPSGFLGVGSEARRQTYYGMMSSIACQYGIPVGLFDAMIIRESRYDPTIVSQKNAFGLTQLMPSTAAGLGVDRYDIEQNLRGGARYLRQQLDRFGQYHLALAAYNAGPGRVHGLVPPIVETQGYVENVLGNWARLSGLAGARPTSETTRRAVAVRARAASLLVF